MKSLKQYVPALISSLMLVSLSSCAIPVANFQTKNAALPVFKQESQPILNNLTDKTTNRTLSEKEVQSKSDKLTALVSSGSGNTSNTKATAAPNSQNTVTVTIYQVDNRCQNLVPKKVAVPKTNPITAAVGRVIQQRDSADFSLAGYRVTVDANSSIATVDLRLSPGSRRKFISLSTCEQFALFGSLRKTLTSNPTWKIKNVRFTQQGQEIVL